MREANPHLSADQARHLTIHGTNQNEDDTYSWKFDNYVHLHAPSDFSGEDLSSIWAQISCPVLLISGAESWNLQAGVDLPKDFQNARHEIVPGAGHWVHHDQLDVVTGLVSEFLR
jgi:pimeloyl-ACP methyl ester carboxylesterase